MIKIDAGNFIHLGDKLCLLKAANCLARSTPEKVFINIDLDLPYKKYFSVYKFNEYDINISDTIFARTKNTDGNLTARMMSCIGFKNPFDVIPIPINLPYPGQLNGYGLNQYITFQQNSYYYNSCMDDNYKKKLVELLTQLNLPIIYVGKTEDIKEKISGVTYLDCPKELSDLQFISMLLANALCHIGADSGMGHLSACFGTPRLMIQDSEFGFWWEIGCTKPELFIQKYSGRWAKLIPSSSGPNLVFDYVNAIKNNPCNDRGWNNKFHLIIDDNSDQQILSKSLFSFAATYPCSEFIISVNNTTKLSNTLINTAAMCDAKITNVTPENSKIINFGDFSCKLNWGTPKTINLSESNLNKMFTCYKSDYYNNDQIQKDKEYLGVDFKVFPKKPITGKNTSVIMAFFGNDNLRRSAFEYSFKQLQKQNLPVTYILVEGLLQDQKSQISSKITQLSNVKYVPIILDDSQKDLFQKECLWNIGVENTEDDTKYLIFLDGDCYSSKTDWFNRIKDALSFNETTIVYGGKYVSIFNYKTREILNCDVTVGKFIDDIKNQMKSECLDFSPGFCYGMTKEVFYNIGGFNPYGAFYGGDTIFIYEVSREIRPSWNFIAENSHFKYCLRKEILKLELNFVCLSDTITHIWHGNPEERRYRDYYLFLTNNNIDIRKYVFIDSQGLLQWKYKDENIKFFIEFKNRKDKSITYNEEITNYFQKNKILFSQNFDCSLIEVENERIRKKISFPNKNSIFTQFLHFEFKSDIESKSYKLFSPSLNDYYNVDVDKEQQIFFNQKRDAWLLFRNVPLFYNFKTLSFLYSSNNKNSSASLEIRIDSKTGPIICEVPIEYTENKSKYSYVDISYEFEKIENHDIYVIYKGQDSICDLEWLTFENPKKDVNKYDFFSVYYSNPLVHQNISNMLKTGYIELDLRVLKCNDSVGIRLQSRDMRGGLPNNKQTSERIVLHDVVELSTNWKPIKIPLKLFDLKEVNPKYIRGIVIDSCGNNSVDIRRIKLYESCNNN